LSCTFYAGGSIAGVSCRRRWPPPTTLALTTLVAQCELSGRIIGLVLEVVGRKFLHTADNLLLLLLDVMFTCWPGVVRWPAAGDTADKARLSDSRVTNMSKSFTHKMAAKTSWHRYITKLRHCHRMYSASDKPVRACVTYHVPVCCVGWRRGAVVSGVRRTNEVNARRARLVPGWVTVFGRVHHLGMQQAN